MFICPHQRRCQVCSLWHEYVDSQPGDRRKLECMPEPPPEPDDGCADCLYSINGLCHGQCPSTDHLP